MMETMRVMSLDQKSRFLMLGPCSSGGTAFDWRQKDIMDSQFCSCIQQDVLCSESTEVALKSRNSLNVNTHIKYFCFTHTHTDLQGLSDIPCCRGHGSCWKCTRRWSWDRPLRSPSPPGSPSGGSAAPGPEHKCSKTFSWITSKSCQIHTQH